MCPAVLNRVWEHMSLNQDLGWWKPSEKIRVSLIKITWKPQTSTQKLH